MTIASECVDRGRAGASPTRRSASSTTSPTESASGELTVEEFEAGQGREPRAARRRVRRDRAGAVAGPVVSLAVTDATARRRAVGLRVEDGAIAELGPGVGPATGDEVIDADGMAIVPGPRQRPHPRGDDPVPRLRRRPAADGVARAGRSGRPRRGSTADDVYWGTRLACVEMIRPARCASGTCTGTPGRGAGGRATPGSGRRSAPPLLDGWRRGGRRTGCRGDGGSAARGDRRAPRARRPPPRRRTRSTR